MNLLIWLVVAIVIFCLLCWIISLAPMPPGAPPYIKNALYILLAVVAISFLANTFMGGGCGGFSYHAPR